MRLWQRGAHLCDDGQQKGSSETPLGEAGLSFILYKVRLLLLWLIKVWTLSCFAAVVEFDPY